MPPHILLSAPHRQLYNLLPKVSKLVSNRHSAFFCICGGYINSMFPEHSLQEQLGGHETAICWSSNQLVKREISVVVSSSFRSATGILCPALYCQWRMVCQKLYLVKSIPCSYSKEWREGASTSIYDITMPIWDYCCLPNRQMHVAYQIGRTGGVGDSVAPQLHENIRNVNYSSSSSERQHAIHSLAQFSQWKLFRTPT